MAGVVAFGIDSEVGGRARWEQAYVLGAVESAGVVFRCRVGAFRDGGGVFAAMTRCSVLDVPAECAVGVVSAISVPPLGPTRASFRGPERRTAEGACAPTSSG